MEKAVGAALITILLAYQHLQMVSSSDPELVQDFPTPSGAKIDSSFFTSTHLRGGANASAGSVGFKPVSSQQLPSLEGLGISFGLFEFPPGTVTPPHYHPRGTELFYIIEGSLEVGFVDTTNKLFKGTLYQGDVFVFPKALIHFQQNPSTSTTTTRAISGFSSSNPGTVLTPSTVFGSGIPEEVLKGAFRVSSSVITQLETPFKST